MDDELFQLLGRMSDDQLARVIEKLPDGQRDHLAQMAEEYGAAIRREKGQKQAKVPTCSSLTIRIRNKRPNSPKLIQLSLIRCMSGTPPARGSAFNPGGA